MTLQLRPAQGQPKEALDCASPHLAAQAPAQAQWVAQRRLRVWHGSLSSPAGLTSTSSHRARHSLCPHHLLCSLSWGAPTPTPPGMSSAELQGHFLCKTAPFTQSPSSGVAPEGPSFTPILEVQLLSLAAPTLGSQAGAEPRGTGKAEGESETV